MARSIKAHTNGYASAADLLGADDLQQKDLTVPGWKVAGVPAKIRVRGLTLPERESVLLGSWKDGKQEELLLVAGYLRHGIVKPELTADQALALAQKHAGTVAYVARFIQDLTNLDYDLIEAVARSLITERGEADTGENPPATQ